MKNQKLSGKVIYIVSTGCNRSVEIPSFVKKLESQGAKVYFFATEECQKIIADEKSFENINYRKSNNTKKRNEIEKEDLILIAPCSFNTLNKIANGIADSYPLTLIHTGIGRNIPIIISASMNINLWNNFNTKKSLDLISENKNITLIWPEIKLNPETKELKSSMASWNKIEDTIMNKFHIIPFEATCGNENNDYNSRESELYRNFNLYGRACKEIHVCPDKAGCIAERVENGIAITATGADVGKISPEDIVLIKKVEDGIVYYDGKKKPSSESLLAWNLLKNKPVGVKMVHCHCRKITYSLKNEYCTTKDYFLSSNKEQIEEVENILNNNDYVNLRLHGQVFIGDTFEGIIGNIVSKYCSLLEEGDV